MSKIVIGNTGGREGRVTFDTDGKDGGASDSASLNSGTSQQGKPSIGTAFSGTRISSGQNFFCTVSNPG